MRFSYEHVESFLQSYPFLLTVKFVTSSIPSPGRFRACYDLAGNILASSEASPGARTSSCNNRDRRKAAPFCARSKSQKVETIEHIETIDRRSIRSIPRADKCQIALGSRNVFSLLRQYEKFKRISTRASQ